MKTCTKCGVVKPLSEFYKHKRDGYQSRCKECAKEDDRKYYQGNRKAIQAHKKEYSKRPERKAAIYRCMKKRRAAHPEKHRAHNAVSYAIRTGRLERQPCEVCGEVDAHAHHDDYLKPLDVRWLCFIHHRMTHGQLAYMKDEP